MIPKDLEKIRKHLFENNYGLETPSADPTINELLKKRAEGLNSKFEQLIKEVDDWFEFLHKHELVEVDNTPIYSNITQGELHKYIRDNVNLGFVPLSFLLKKVRSNFKVFNSNLDNKLLKHFQDSDLYTMSVDPTTVWLKEQLPEGYVPIDHEFLINESWSNNRAIDSFGRNIYIEELTRPIIKKKGGNELNSQDLLRLIEDKIPLFFAVNYNRFLEYDSENYQLRPAGDRVILDRPHMENNTEIKELLRTRFKDLERLEERQQNTDRLDAFFNGLLYMHSRARRTEFVMDQEMKWELTKSGRAAYDNFLDGDDIITRNMQTHNVPAILYYLTGRLKSVRELQEDMTLPAEHIVHTLYTLSTKNREVCIYNRGPCFNQEESWVKARMHE